LAIIVRILGGTEPEVIVRVVVLGNVEENRRCLEDGEVAALDVDEGRNGCVGVYIDKPRNLRQGVSFCVADAFTGGHVLA
jgi:hypothetical protein